MFRYLLHRLVVSCVGLVGLTVLVYLIVRITPGAAQAGARFESGVYRGASAEDADKPPHDMATSYLRWLKGLVVDERISDAVVSADGRRVYVDPADEDRLLVESDDGGWLTFVPEPNGIGGLSYRVTDQFGQLGEQVVALDGQAGGRADVPDDAGVTIRPLGLPVKRFAFTLGRSATSGRPVVEEIGQRLPITLMLNVSAMFVSWVGSLLLGLALVQGTGQWWGGALERFMLTVWAVPMVLAATLVIALAMACGGSWALAPLVSTQWDDAGPGVLMLPVLCLSYVPTVYLARQWQSAIGKEMTSDYVKTALAKGATRGQVIGRHVLRNALPPMIVLAAGSIAYLIVGSAIVETAFGINGMGRLAVQAAGNRDATTVQALALVVGLVQIVALLAGDVLCRLVDPRIAMGARGAAKATVS